MSVARFIVARLNRFRVELIQSRLLRRIDCEQLRDTLRDWTRSLADPTSYYIDCFRFFHGCVPAFLREHRTYFSQKGRGFGEDAFHVMWWMLFRRFKITNFLEIGVYRGQILSLAGLLQRADERVGHLAGISPFESVGDSVSKYRNGIDYFSDTYENFAHFGLPEPVLLRAYSTDPIAVQMINSRVWDCIYIDGSHDYETVTLDWQHSSECLRPGGLIVLDDSALRTRYQPPVFATKGHPGPSQIADEVDRARFREILRVGHNRVFQKSVDSG